MNRADLEALDRATLADLVLRQAERMAELEARLAEMERRFEELERRASRGAAPFARPESKRSPSPKRPSRSVFQKTIRFDGPKPPAYAFGVLVKSVTSSTASRTGSIPCSRANRRASAWRSGSRSGSVEER